MAAIDAFTHFVSSLPAEDRTQLDGLIKERREELFAARSEHARLRIVEEFIAEVRDRLKNKKPLTVTRS